MAGRGSRVGLVAFLSLTVVAIGAGIYVLSIALSDHLTFRRGGPAYAIVVTSGTVRDFPQFGAVKRGAEYTYSARDGTAPGHITMTYASTVGVEDLERRYRDHCARQGYARVPEDRHLLASRLGCDASDYRIEVGFRRQNGTTLVTVDFLER